MASLSLSCREIPSPQFFGRLALSAFLLLTSGCGEPVPTQKGAISLLDADSQFKWQTSDIPDGGAVDIQSALLRIGPGLPMTGVRFAEDWDALGLPWIDYALTFEARRVEGQDFFATCTFPVGEANRCVSLVVGGWGGGLVGISCIDQLDASENNTRGEMAFKNGTWYRFRIEVRQDDLQCRINGAPMVNVSIKGRQLNLRSGDIDRCTPLGFATWRTTGEIRSVCIQRL